ncbi:MAG TPA: hypothetical protein ENH60_02255 [Pricia sp.]|uniref:Bacterial DNA polymerase III alpha subunit NTPase domain-containing protein n=1 Tax=Pricia antarctica TaxID=641691 RepID=A0A831VWV4_9FLAO|nr:hypothetical protein [Pricia sp.]HEA22819.1 hypothetical protein [Pricia antarctica]
MNVGRGSGVNSVISYSLSITDIWAIGLNLYFEQFLNENRKSSPDFDLDRSSRERYLVLC